MQIVDVLGDDRREPCRRGRARPARDGRGRALPPRRPPPSQSGGARILSRASWLATNSSNGIGRLRVQIPPGERKSGMPHSVEMPAPVNGTMVFASAIMSPSRSTPLLKIRCNHGQAIPRSRAWPYSMEGRMPPSAQRRLSGGQSMHHAAFATSSFSAVGLFFPFLPPFLPPPPSLAPPPLPFLGHFPPPPPPPPPPPSPPFCPPPPPPPPPPTHHLPPPPIFLYFSCDLSFSFPAWLQPRERQDC